MSDGHLKTPLNLSLNRLAGNRAKQQAFMAGKSLPCTVSEVVSSGIVKVSFQVNGGKLTIPQVTMPIEAPEYIRYPIQKGDKGMAIAASVRLGGMSGLGSGQPDLSQPANLAGLSFVWLGNKNWTAPIDPNSVEIYGVEDGGVILRDGNNTVRVTLSSDGIVIETGGNSITVNGGGDVTVNDGGDVFAGGISLMNHTHGGVMSGPDETDPPS